MDDTMKAKYVIVLCMGLEMPIVFNCLLDHASVCQNLKAVSAGFCRRGDDGTYSVWGKSQTLNLNNRPEDAAILQNDLEKDF